MWSRAAQLQQPAGLRDSEQGCEIVRERERDGRDTWIWVPTLISLGGPIYTFAFESTPPNLTDENNTHLRGLMQAGSQGAGVINWHQPVALSGGVVEYSATVDRDRFTG